MARGMQQRVTRGGDKGGKPRGGPAVRDPETRERLRESARTLFAERGFHKVTVREVCLAARANVAAINYHFGDKLGLYVDIVQDGIAIMRESNRLGEDAGRGLPADERLRAFLRVFLTRVAGGGEKGSWLAQIMAREMEDPTPAMDLVVEQVIAPRMAYLGEAIAELLDCPVSDPRVTRCFASIQGQCLIYRPHLVRERFLKITGPLDIEALTHHITEFSLAGIRALADKKPSRATARPVARSGARVAEHETARAAARASTGSSKQAPAAHTRPVRGAPTRTSTRKASGNR